MKNPKISVVIPAYNQSEYLAQAIESVVLQTKTPHEIFVIDDGSNDGSANIARSYPVTLIQQANKGLASARNTGIMNMTGDYFFPLDADDMMNENCIEKITEMIEKTNADIVAPSFKCFGMNNSEVILMKDPQLNDFKSLDGINPANRIGYFSVIRKSVLLEVGGYSPKMAWGWEDYHLWINLLSVGKKIVTIPDILILYRTKEKSMITEANAHAVELWSQIYKDFPNFK